VPTQTPNVLVVFDGSALAERALLYAIDRAQAMSAGITVLAVIPPRLWRAQRGQFQVEPYRHDEPFAREQLARAKGLCRDKGIRARGRVRSGAPLDVIIDEASRGYELFVIGDRRNPSGAPSLGALVRDQASCEVVLLG
jgi:nucleotide-binding universal stress UspA family protein